MFKLDDNEEIIIRNWPVVITVPQDGGAVQKNEITADFLLLPQDQLDELLAASRDGDVSNADPDLLRRVVQRLGGIGDAGGTAIDYTPDLLERMIKKPFVRSALVTSYFEASAGKKAKRKN